MAQASDLMGLSMNPLLAQRVADVGVGPINVTAVGNSQTTAYAIRGAQYFIVASASGASNLGVALPLPGGDTGPLLGDNFIVNNVSTQAVSLYPATGVTVYFQGSVFTSTAISISQYHNMECWVISSVAYMAAAN